MPDLVAMIQTTWSNIRVALYKHENGLFQFMEEGLDERGKKITWQCAESGYFSDIQAAKEAMLYHYCELTEDEYKVVPESVTILEAPDFKGPHHPVLVLALGTEPQPQ